MEKFLVSRFSVCENDAARRHWSREPITTLSAPSMFMFRFILTDYNAGQIFIPHRRAGQIGPPARARNFLQFV